MLLLILISLFLVPCAYPRYDKVSLKAEVIVREGIQECQADCLDFESKGRFKHLCSKLDCLHATTSKVGAERPEIEKKVELVIYKDALTNKKKMRLEFFWTPSDDYTIQHLLGYRVHVKDSSHITKSGYVKCFNVTRKNFQIGYKTKFRDNCYGANELTEIIPGSIFFVEITSIPYWPTDHENTMSRMIVTIPSCRDPSLRNVSLCKNFSEYADDPLHHDGKILQKYCQNHSVEYSYSLSPVYGEWVVIKLCEHHLGLLHCELLLETYDHLVLNNTLYNISINSADISKEYILILSGNRHLHETMSNISFSDCPVEMEQPTNILVLILCVSISFAIVFLSFAIVLTIYLRHVKMRKRRESVDLPTPHDPQEQTTERKRVYVISTIDHELHSQTVDIFCRYLQQDLGLDVRMCEWEEFDVAVNRAMYMETNLQLADKVIIVCSRGTRNCLRQNNKMNDMFSPVLRRILDQTFLGNNVDKFLVGYFDYSSPDDIPSLLKDYAEIYLSYFKLMKQFESFYFRLVGIEQYQQRGVQRIDKIAFDRYYETTYGKLLKKCIDNMKQYVSENPTWYTDVDGDAAATLYLPPTHTVWNVEVNDDIIIPVANPTMMATGVGTIDICELGDGESLDVVNKDDSEEKSFVVKETREKRYYKDTTFELCHSLESDSSVLCERMPMLNGTVVQVEEEPRKKVVQLGKPESFHLPLIANMSNHVDQSEEELQNREQSAGSLPKVIFIGIDGCESDNVDFELGKINQEDMIRYDLLDTRS